MMSCQMSNNKVGLAEDEGSLSEWSADIGRRGERERDSNHRCRATGVSNWKLGEPENSKSTKERDPPRRLQLVSTTNIIPALLNARSSGLDNPVAEHDPL
jgi:hypothetical protein